MLFGTNELSPALLKILDIDQPNGNFSSGRFRDISLNEDGTEIILYTRNGGGNREEYQSIFDHFSDSHSNYLHDYDDDFDSTYAYIVFTVPEEYKEDLKHFASGNIPETVSDKFQKLLSELKKG